MCIDMLQELQTYLNTNSTRFEVYRVRFNYHSVENVFWVDSLSISTTPVTGNPSFTSLPLSLSTTLLLYSCTSFASTSLILTFHM